MRLGATRFVDQLGIVVEDAARLAVLEGMRARGEQGDILGYANELLARATLPQLSAKDLERAVRALRRAGLLTPHGHTLALTDRGEHALDLLVNGSRLVPPRRKPQASQ